MRKFLILLIFSSLAVSASAQYADRSIVDLRGSRVFLNGEKMSNHEVIARITAVHGEDTADAWARTSRAYRTGKGLTISGASLAVLGGTTVTLGALAAMGVALYVPLIGMVGVVAGGDTGAMVDEMMSRPETLMTVGSYVLLGGTAMLASGIPIMCVSKKKLDGMFREHDYGLQNELRFTLGPTSNGVGLALNF